MTSPASASDTAAATRPAGLLPFAVLIGGQLASFISSTFVSIGVGMWVLQKTGSIVDYAWLLVLTLVPAVLLSPLGGVIADRWPKKRSMIAVDALAASFSGLILLLLVNDSLQVWHLYASAVVNGICLGLQRPLYESVTPLMVPVERLANVNGIVHTVAGIGQVAAPALAGAVLTQVGLVWMVVIDLCSFALALTCIALVRVPDARPPGGPASAQAWRTALSEGWAFVRQRVGLLALFWFVMLRNFLFATCEVMALPLLLTLTSPDRAGLVLSLGGIGIVAGGALMGLLGHGRRLIGWVFLAQALTGLAMIVAGISTDIWIIAAAVAFAFLAFPVEEATSTTIMQRKVPAALLGRVSSIRNMMTMGAAPLAMALAAPVAQHVFEPLMAQGGALATWLGPLLGTGPGRGMALLLLLLGFATLALTLAGYCYAPLRELESDLPDQVAPSAPETVTARPDPTQKSPG